MQKIEKIGTGLGSFLAVAIAALGLAACGKDDPTLGERMNEASEEIQDEAGDLRRDIKDEIDDAH